MAITICKQAGAVSILLLSSFATFAQRRVVNSSFEQPIIPANTFRQINEDVIDGWETTHPVNSGCNVGPATCRPIEYWREVFQGVSAATGAGAQWAEINSSTNSMIYQNQCLVNGESFSYSFLHRARGSATIPDVMQFRIGIPAGLPAGSEPADPYSFSIVQVSTTNNGTVTSPPTGSGTINPPIAAGNGWVRYSGNYTYTGTSQFVKIGFVAISTGSGNLSIGNFVDSWDLTLLPFFEFSAASLGEFEGTVISGGSVNPSNPPSVRVQGNVGAPLTIRVAVTGGTATLGEDYSLTSTFQSGSSISFVDIVVPAGSYDGASTGLFPIPFSVSADNDVELDETVDFGVSLLGGSASLSSVASCGGAAISSTSYTIQNDDILTAGDAEVSGFVLDENGNAVIGAQLYMFGLDGMIFSARSNIFGRFRFTEVETGNSYLLLVYSRSHVFQPQFVTVNESIDRLRIQGVRRVNGLSIK